jgi:hypothetical protein
MADRMAADIEIGGKVRRSVAEALCKVINESGTSLEWGGGCFQPETINDLLAARCDDGDNPRVLKLFDDQARWGEFEELEKFLREHEITYCRHSEGKYEFTPEAAGYLPQLGPVVWLTDHERWPILLASEVRPVETQLARVVRSMERGKATMATLTRRIKTSLKLLRAALPPDVPALESFEIVED